MVLRVRVRDTDLLFGTATESTGAVFERNRYMGREYCADHSPSSGDMYFDTVKSSHKGGTLNGIHHWNPGLSVTYNDWIADRYQTFDADDVVPSFADFDVNHFAANIGSRTNPSRPEVDLPLSIFELRELPSLINRFGGNLLRKFSDAYLRGLFGVGPILNDALSLINFVEAAERRILQLRKMRKYGKLTKKANYRTDKWRGSPVNVMVNSLNFSVYATEYPSAQREIWGYSKWAPDDPVDWRSDLELARRAKRSLLGIERMSFSTAWNAIPWTWLIDWFTNIGNVLETNRNSIGVHCTGIYLCVTQEKNLRSLMTHSDSPAISMSTFDSTTVEKYRTLVPVVPAVTIPFLTERQLSILSAIGIQRYR